MAATTDKDRLINRSDISGVNPIPTLKFPALPQRIVQIDPAGCAAYQQQLEQSFADWVQKVNVVTNGLASQIKT
jgi:hypothetical protein